MPWIVYEIVLGTGFLDIWRVSMSYHLGLDRDYGLWLAYHLYDFFAFLGVPLALLVPVALLACYVPGAERGEAAEMLLSRDFRGVAKLTAAAGRDGADSFQYTGGTFAADQDAGEGENIFLAIVGAEALQPARLAEERKLRFSIDPAAFLAPENPLRLSGRGRIAFKLQRRVDQSPATISNGSGALTDRIRKTAV